MAITFENASDSGHLIFYGSTTIAKNTSKVLLVEGYPGAVQVHINGTGVAAFMVSVTTYPTDKVLAETAQFIDAEASDLDEDQDFNLDYGVSAVKITNRSTSTDTIDVAWRVRKI